MSDLTAAIAKAELMLDDLYKLDDASGHPPDLLTQIEAATSALEALRGEEVEADQATIDRLNAQLDSVSQSVSDALADLSKIANVINQVAGVVGILQGIAGLV